MRIHPAGFRNRPGVNSRQALLPWRTALKNVELPLEVGGRRSLPPGAATPRELMALVGLAGWENSYPVRIIIGEGVTMAGTLGHFKGFADFWRKEHLWEPMILLHGKPTFMMGRAQDPDSVIHNRYPAFACERTCGSKSRRMAASSSRYPSPSGSSIRMYLMSASMGGGSAPPITTG